MRKVKLITEQFYDVEVIEESLDNQEKNLYIEGIFSSADTMVQNGRIYKRPILEREIDKFINEKVKRKMSWGELNHNNLPDIDPKNVSHLITELKWDGNNVIGKAKIVDTPNGQIVKSLMKEGVLAISSRGLGTVNESYVNDDYSLITWDVVSTPSNPTSYVNGIYEAKEFIVQEVEKETEKKLEELSNENNLTEEEIIKKINLMYEQYYNELDSFLTSLLNY